MGVQDILGCQISCDTGINFRKVGNYEFIQRAYIIYIELSVNVFRSSAVFTMRRPPPLLSFEGNQEKPISSRRKGVNIQSKRQCDDKICRSYTGYT